MKNKRKYFYRFFHFLAKFADPSNFNKIEFLKNQLQTNKRMNVWSQHNVFNVFIFVMRIDFCFLSLLSQNFPFFHEVICFNSQKLMIKKFMCNFFPFDEFQRLVYVTRTKRKWISFISNYTQRRRRVHLCTTL